MAQLCPPTLHLHTEQLRIFHSTLQEIDLLMVVLDHIFGLFILMVERKNISVHQRIDPHDFLMDQLRRFVVLFPMVIVSNKVHLLHEKGNRVGDSCKLPFGHC